MKSSTSNLLLFKRALSLSLHNIWRNKILSLATIFVIGTILFIFNVILTVNLIAKESLADLNKKVDIVVYLKESTTNEQSQTLIKEFKAIEGVENATLTTKEDALNQLKTTHPDISLAFEKYKLGNPLPASINIVTTEPKYHQSIRDFISQEKYQIYLSNVVSDNQNKNDSILQSVSNNLIKVTNFANQLIFWIILTFIIGGTLIILNAIHITIFNRKKEITVMKLVGAPFWFIKIPFILESILYGGIAVLLSFIMLLIFITQIEIENSKLLLFFSIELLITIVLSALSSVTAVHEYLQKDLLEN